MLHMTASHARPLTWWTGMVAITVLSLAVMLMVGCVSRG
jgi:hypothetical protein